MQPEPHPAVKSVVVCAPSHPTYRRLKGLRRWMRVQYIGPMDEALAHAENTADGRLMLHVDPLDLPQKVEAGKLLPRGVKAPRTWFEGRAQ